MACPQRGGALGPLSPRLGLWTRTRRGAPLPLGPAPGLQSRPARPAASLRAGRRRQGQEPAEQVGRGPRLRVPAAPEQAAARELGAPSAVTPSSVAPSAAAPSAAWPRRRRRLEHSSCGTEPRAWRRRQGRRPEPESYLAAGSGARPRPGPYRAGDGGVTCWGSGRSSRSRYGVDRIVLPRARARVPGNPRPQPPAALRVAPSEPGRNGTAEGTRSPWGCLVTSPDPTVQ